MLRLPYDDINIKKILLIKSGYIQLHKNSINLIKGANGSGKSSLLKNIFYNNKCIIVDQNNDEIINELSVLENIAMNKDKIYLENIKKEITDFKLGHILELESSKLSGGEKRVVSILRAIFSDEELVLMDEPTNDLDYKTVKIILDIINNYSLKKTFLIVTHDDRFDKMADKIFFIENKKIKIKEKIKNISFEKDKNLLFNNKNNRNDNEILDNIFKKNYFNIIMIIIFSIMCSFKTIDIISSSNNIIDEIGTNQIDICIPISQISSENLQEGFYPIGILNNIQSDKSLIENIKNMSNINEYTEYTQVNYSLNLKDTENYNIYPLEYYNTHEKEYYFTLSKIDEDSEKYRDNIKDYIADKKLDFDRFVKDLESKKTKYGNSLEKIYVSIILNDEFTFYDFIKDSQILKLKDDNLYIRSNETILLTNQMALYNKIKSNLIDFAIMIVMIIVLSLMYTYSYINIKSKTISILKNYGIDKHIVKNKLLYLNCNKKINIIMCIILVFINMLMLYFTDNITLYIVYIIPLYFIMTANITNRINKKIIYSKIDKIYSWRYR